MKRILTIVLALGLGGAASAKDAEKKPAAEQKPAAEATAAPAPVVTATPAASDSPMVAAAKRSNRNKARKATIVITNETLNKSGAGAHVTTTAKQPAFATSKEPVRPTPEMLHQQQREAEKRRQAAEAAKQQKAAETKERAAAAAAAAAEEGLYDSEELEPQETQKPPRG